MLTVTALARSCGLSRTAVLYYEAAGLLKRPPRTAGNYRRYGEKDAERLRLICFYRGAGLKLADIRALLDRPPTDARSVLERRLRELGGEIERLRGQQQSILRLLGSKQWPRRNDAMMTKDKWVAIMRGAGFKEDDMQRWHTEFERAAPGDHEEFLKYLQIPAEEIKMIREWSRKGGKT